MRNFFTRPYCALLISLVFSLIAHSGQCQTANTSPFFRSDLTLSSVHSLMDVDQDGDLDYLFTNGYPPFSIMKWRSNLGSGVFGPAQTLVVPSVTTFSGFECADMDGDGITDLAFYMTGGLWMARHGNGPAFFAPVKIIQNAVARRDNQSLLDITGDGKADYVGNNGIAINNGTGQFTPSVLSSFSYYIEDFDVYDVDQDGMLDVVSCFTDGFSGNWNSQVTWMRQTSPGIFQANLITDTIKGAGLIKAYKEPTSGKVVIAVTKPNFLNIGMMDMGTTYFLERNGNAFSLAGYYHNWNSQRFIRHRAGNKEYLLNSALARIDRSSGTCYPPGAWISCWSNGQKDIFRPSYFPASGDVDGNGTIDYVMDGRLWATVDSLGQSAIAGKIDTSFYGSVQHKIADVNLDGHPDLLALGGQQMVVFPGIPGNTFGSPIHIDFSVDLSNDDFPSNNASNKVGIADYNGDGLPDIFAGGNQNRTFFYFQNEGNFRFRRKAFPKLRFKSCSNCIVSQGLDWPIAPSLTFINGDTKPDLLYPFWGRYLGYSLQQSDSNTVFQPIFQDTVQLFDQADINADGLMDIVSLANGKVYWHRRTGGLSFAPRILVGRVSATSSISTLTHFLVAKDIDADGDPDITFAGKKDGGQFSISLYYNQGGTFTTGPKATAPLSAINQINLEDLTGDGFADLLVNDGLFFNHKQDSIYPPSTFYRWGNYNPKRFSFHQNPINGRLQMVVDSAVHTLGIVANVQQKRQQIEGLLFRDKNQNCLSNVGEPGLTQKWIQADPGGFLAITNENGRFRFQLPYGQYQIKPLLSQGNGLYIDSLCPSTQQTVNIDSLHADTVQFGASLLACPLLKIQVQTPRRRMCARNKNVCLVWNEGSEGAYQKLICMRLPRYVHMIESGDWQWNAADSTWRILMDSIPSGKSFRFTWIDSVQCQPDLMGLWQCTKAWIASPSISCVPTVPGWDRSVIQIAAHCGPGGQLTYLLKNTGPGNMTSPRSYFEILNGTQVGSGNYQLASGDSILVQPIVQGGTLHVDQGTENPFNRWVLYRLFWDGTCNHLTGSAISVNPLATQAEDCAEIRNSYDPNEKTAFPFSPQSATTWVRNGEWITYTLHFQNTGNDTAYTVSLADTLANTFEIATLQTLASSNPFVLQVSGNNRMPVLRFDFMAINLPDSNTNRLGSEGFVSFRIQLKRNLPENMVIRNQAAIYFDQNPPIFTNKTSHTIREQYQVVTSNSRRLLNNMAVYPNPAAQKVAVDFGQRVSGEMVLFSSLGQMVQKRTVAQQSTLEWGVSGLAPGLYFLIFKAENGLEMEQKLMIQR